MLRCVVAFVLAAVTIGLRLALVEADLQANPFLLSFPAVLLSAWYGGLLPGLWTSILCASSGAAFPEAFGQPALTEPGPALEKGTSRGIPALKLRGVACACVRANTTSSQQRLPRNFLWFSVPSVSLCVRMT